MIFENKDVGYENHEFYFPIDFQIEKLKEEKVKLEEYIRHLLFINKILKYILEDNYSSKRKTFILEPIKQEDYNNYSLIEALNILLHDTPSHQESFSLEEINVYSKKISNEIGIAERRIDRIWSQLRKYGEDK